MDSETALELVRKGTTLLLLDVPQFTLIGIDTQVFFAGPAFKGIKMIPPGPHFFYYSPSNRDGMEFSPIIGFFVEARASKVIAHTWNQEEERLVKLSEEEEERYAQAVRSMEFDKELGPYALNQFGEWKSLSNYITQNTIERIQPIGGEISIAYESEMIGNIPKTAKEKALAEQLSRSKFSRFSDNLKKVRCYYTSVPRIIKHKGVSARELTSLNLDKTQLLEDLLTKEFGGAEDLLLAELQFAYIAFLMGQSLEAFLQWKTLVTLFFGCTEAPFHTRSHLFTKFIKVIYYQLKFGLQENHRDSDIEGQRKASILFDESWLSADSFLHHLCKEFFQLILEAPVVDGDLLSWTRKVKELLETSLGWSFEQMNTDDGIYFEEDAEFAPVVEMLDGHVL